MSEENENQPPLETETAPERRRRPRRRAPRRNHSRSDYSERPEARGAQASGGDGQSDAYGNNAGEVRSERGERGASGNEDVALQDKDSANNLTVATATAPNERGQVALQDSEQLQPEPEFGEGII